MTAEDLLTRTLTGITETTEYPTTPMSTVVARSRAIRGARRRRIAALAAAAVVVAGGLSATLLLGHGDDSTPGPTGPLGELPQGPAPKVDYLEGDTFVATTGVRISSPALRSAEAAAAYGAGVLVARYSSPSHPLTTLSVVSSESSVRRLGCGLPSFGASAEGGAPAYWLSDSCRERQHPPRLVGGHLFVGRVSTATPRGTSYFPVGQLTDGVVSRLSGVTPAGANLRHHVVVVGPGGSQRPIPHLSWALGTSSAADLVSGVTSDLAGSTVIDASSGRVLWRQPDWTLTTFSTSGRYVAGRQGVTAEDTNPSGVELGIWDAATGRQVMSTVLHDLTVTSGPSWEGDGSFLLSVRDPSHQESILRVGLDGTVTRATRVAPASNDPVPVFRLAATP